MKISIDSILSYLEEQNISCEYKGKINAEIETFCSLNNLKNYGLTWIKNIKTFDMSKLSDDLNLTIVCNKLDTMDSLCHNFIFCEHPKEVYFCILEGFFSEKRERKIKASSIVETTNIGKNVSIGHNCYICKDVILEDDVTIGNNVSIVCRVKIGKGTVIHSGTVIGIDGFGYYKDNSGKNKLVPHFGGVIIGEDVEIGANCIINRGTLDDTIIGNNVKIESLSQIAHNVVIGDRCIILGGIGGSCYIGEDSYLAPHSYVKNQVNVGKNCMVNMNTVLTENLADGYIATGTPTRIYKMDYKKLLNL